MSQFDEELKQLIFDYCLGLTTQKESEEAEALIRTNEEAARIHSGIKEALSPLEYLEPDVCPQRLAENTVSYVNSFKDSGQQNLEQLLTTEQNKNVFAKISFGRNFTEIFAIAASIVFILALMNPFLNATRQRSRRQICQKQMSNIFQGFNNYISENDGQQPAVATVAGAPWWKIGDQGEENQSNTRHIYLLVKNDYVDMGNFVCPGCGAKRLTELNSSQIKKLKDFPSRSYITYSFQIRCQKTASGKLKCRKIIMADLNPLFERIPEDFNGQLQLKLDRNLITINSNNHRQRGQNVLFGDGHVEFIKTRFVGISEDDIFTLQDTDVYQGSEIPSCETDFFLAP